MNRYIAIKDDDLLHNVELIVRADDLDTIQHEIGFMVPDNIRIYELKYEVEPTLCRVSYEGESENLDTLPDVTRPATDDEVSVCRCATSKKRNDMISHPGALNRSSTVEA